MSITGSMQLVGRVEELVLRVAALESNQNDLLTRLEKLSGELASLRMRVGKHPASAKTTAGKGDN
jgi:chaperonin cofactor prefoldin